LHAVNRVMAVMKWAWRGCFVSIYAVSSARGSLEIATSSNIKTPTHASPSSRLIIINLLSALLTIILFGTLWPPLLCWQPIRSPPLFMGKI
jgi:hypothetical protein